MVFHPSGNPIRVLDCVAGGGMLGLAIHTALAGRCRTVCYIERDAYAASCLVARMADASLDPAPVWDDLATFDGRPWRGAVDCVCAGLPCQPYSVAGRRHGHADERAIWPEFIRVLDEIEPGAVFLENSPRLVSGGYFRDIGERLLGMGYRIPPALEVSAKDVGASHLRNRAFILAYREGVDGWRRIQTGARQARERRGRLGSLGHGLVHPDGARRPPSGRGCAFDAGRKFEPGRSDLADAPELLGPAIERGQPDGIDESMADPPRRRLPQCDLSTRRGASVSHADGAGRTQRKGRCGDTSAERASPQRIRPCPGLFAPDPDSPRWPGILARRPDLEPSLCRVADGLAHRVDRLRVCGNGVVPLAAAVAFGFLVFRESVRKQGG